MKGAGSVRRATGIVQRVRRHEGLGKRRLETAGRPSPEMKKWANRPFGGVAPCGEARPLRRPVCGVVASSPWCRHLVFRRRRSRSWRLAVALEGVKRNEVHGGAFAVSNIALGSVIELQVRQPGRLIGDAKIQNAGVALDRGHVQPDAVDGTFLVTVKFVLERDAAMLAEGFGHTMKKPTSGRSRLLREIVRSHSWQTRFQ